MKPVQFGLTAPLYKKSCVIDEDTGLLISGVASGFYGSCGRYTRASINENSQQVRTNYKITTCESGFDYSDKISVDNSEFFTILEIKENRDFDNRLINTVVII